MSTKADEIRRLGIEAGQENIRERQCLPKATAVVYVDTDDVVTYTLSVPEGEGYYSGTKVELPTEFVLEYLDIKAKWYQLQKRLQDAAKHT